MSPPRKPRQPGRRSGWDHPSMGSPADWARVANDPQVQRALADPQIAQALYRNFRQTGGQMPPMPQPQQPQPMRGGGAMHFDTGGTLTDIDAKITKAQAAYDQAVKKNDQNARVEAQKTLQDLYDQRTKLQTAPLSGSSSSGVSLGGASISGDTMSGLKKMQTAGPATLGNMAAAIGGGALMGGAAQGGSPLGALVGAGTAGLLNYFLRKHGKKKEGGEGGGDSGGGGGGGGGTNEPTGSYSGPSAQQSYSPSASGSGAAGSGGAPPQSGAVNPAQSGAGLWYGTANTGFGDPNVKSYDGKKWVDSRGNAIEPSKVINQTQVTTPTGAPAAPQTTTPQTAMPTTPREQTPPNHLPSIGTAGGLGALDPSLSTSTNSMGLPSISTFNPAIANYDFNESTGGAGLAKGGPIPKKHGVVIPVLHIAIMARPKDQAKGRKPVVQKAMGGELPQSQRQPRKPAAIPPVGGPQPFGPTRPLPHGRVQVPKGTGAAIKGKRFGGIY